MGICASCSVVKSYIVGEEEFIGHKIFCPITVGLISVTNIDEDIKQLYDECVTDIQKAEETRQKIALSFEDMLIKTGACVLQKPNFERAVVSYVVLLLVYIVKSCKENGKEVKDEEVLQGIKNLFSFSLTPPFMHINEEFKEKMRTDFGLDPDKVEDISKGSDSIKHFLESLATLSSSIINQKYKFVSSFKILQNKFSDLLSDLTGQIREEDERTKNNRLVLNEIMKSVESLDFISDVVNEMTDSSLEIVNKAMNPNRINKWLKIAKDAEKSNRLSPIEICYYYCGGEKCVNMNDYRENFTYKVLEDKLEY